MVESLLFSDLTALIKERKKKDSAQTKKNEPQGLTVFRHNGQNQI